MKLLFILLVAGALSAPAYSHDYLYRADTRGPDQIFNDGFLPPGNNRNLLHHAEGLSCARNDANAGIEPTGYIELNERAGAVLVMRTRLQMLERTQPNPIVWRYEVLPSPNDYNVGATFAQRINPTARVNLNTGRVAGAHMRAEAQQTWVATEPIAGNRVRNARAFTLNRGELVEIPNMMRLNPRYVDRPVVRNENPLPIETIAMGIAEPAQGRRVIGAGAAMVSACACASSRYITRAADESDDRVCRDNIISISEVSIDQAFTALNTPSGLDPRKKDDGL